MIKNRVPPQPTDAPGLGRTGGDAIGEGAERGTLLRRVDVREVVVPDTADALDRFFLTGRRVAA
ncbi:hypothetical protein [Streptomyces sp. NPDC048106]|uniref:hypothetical protein n=1 Tax=Streptomyces sp. NPDC048106 TaxID=3155750 RepID=UPI0034569C49